MTRTSTEFDFKSASGAVLAGRLDMPAEEPVAYALFAHCFTCSKDSFAAARISRQLAEHGIAVLRFDFTGLGNSEGEFANTNFSSNIDDLVAAAKALAEAYKPPQILIGHSLGGAAVIAATKHLAEIKLIATIAAPADPAHVTHHFSGKEKEIKTRGLAEIDIAGRSFTVKQQFLEDISTHNLREILPHYHGATLVFHSPQDDIVSFEDGERLFSWAPQPKSFLSLAEAGHLLPDKHDAAYIAAVVAASTNRMLGRLEDHHMQHPAHNTVIVSESGEGKFTQQIQAGPHRLTGDEPADKGGNDAGPSPYQYLLAALRSCTSMTLRMYADHKGIDVRQIKVRLSHEKIKAEDSDNKSGKIDQIVRELSIDADLTEEQRKRFVQIADKCPVHKTLVGQPVIKTTFSDEK